MTMVEFPAAPLGSEHCCLVPIYGRSFYLKCYMCISNGASSLIGFRFTNKQGFGVTNCRAFCSEDCRSLYIASALVHYSELGIEVYFEEKGS